MIKSTGFSNYIQCLSQADSINKILALGCGRLVMEKLLNPVSVLAVDWADDILQEHIPDSNIIPMKADILEICKYIPTKSFDTITLFDALEHLTKEKALLLLTEVERICSNQILLFIPIEDDSTSEEDREQYVHLQQELKEENQQLGFHLSVWAVKELESLGFIGEYSHNYHRNSKHVYQRGWGACFGIKKVGGCK